MSNARTNILSRLCQSSIQETPPQPSPYQGREQEKDDWDTAERVRRFTERMEAVRAEIHHASRTDWLDVLAEICKAKGLNNLLVAAETEWGSAIHAQAQRFPALKTYQQPIETWKSELFYGIDAAFTGTRGGIAETGTLILWPDAHEPRTMSLVPPIHIALLETDKLYTTFAEAMQAEGWVETGMPTNALLVSGPSKSADIEQTLAYGVHGPKELVVILV
ncbi:MAG: lactate utilization protein [Thiothrix sp.]|uniref:LutC/YkgG family protein n=1 Tax=Thiothrix sp. TaxID=1032 RepID=UPI00260C0099|nr:lactate utilization protein [Thiothrix sp.]MDD5393561.1 lactate utilization protein [Thiothrix sp.]